VKITEPKILPCIGDICPHSKQSQLFAPTDGIVPVVEVGAVACLGNEGLLGFALRHCRYEFIAQDAEFFQGFDFGGAVISA